MLWDGERHVPTAIAVTSPELVLPPPDRQTPGAHVLTPPDRQSLEHAIAETNLLLERHGYVIVLYPDGLPTAFVHRLHTVRAVLESDRIALLPVALPPLATAVVARQLRHLSVCDFSPGILGAAVRLLTHYVYGGALLNSVSRLERIPVHLTAHVRSWVPGAQFAVLAGPTPQLIRVGSEGDSLQGPAYATHLMVAEGQLPADWVTTTLAHQWRVQGVQHVRLPSESPSWWGTAKLVEFAAGILDISILYQLVGSVRREECHWCGLELIGDRCAFCAAPLVAESRPRAVTAARRRAITAGVRTDG